MADTIPLFAVASEAATPIETPAQIETATAAPKTVEEALDGASSADLDAILDALDNEPEAKEAETPEPPKAEVETSTAAAPEATAAADPIRERFLKLMEAEPGTDPAELWQRAGGKSRTFTAQPEAAAEETAAATAAAEVAQVDPFAGQRAKITELKTQRTEARKAYEYDKADELSDQISDVQREIILGESQIQRQQEDSQRFDAAHAEAKASVLKDHPAAGDKTSPLYAALARENAYLQVHDPAFFAKPDFPARLIAQVKAQRPDLFSPPPAAAVAQPVSAAAPTPKPTLNGKSPNAVVRQTPVGAVVAGDASTGQMTAPDALSAIEAMSEAELDALIAEMPAAQKRAAPRR
jgi:hypothetical protein